jgi:dihydroorotate dehydrogenase electron transfer subunit
MIIFQEKTTVLRNDQLSDDIFRLTVRSPDIACTARPGQFVMVQAGDGTPLLRRPFSVHQVMADGSLQILFKVLGTGTKILSRTRAGEQLDIIGPLGRGFYFDPGSPACLVGGGMGIAPLLFLAKKMLQKGFMPGELIMLLGARTKDELAPLAGGFKAMGITPQLITDDGTLGEKGLVTKLLARIKTGFRLDVFCCGPHPMMRGVAELCKEKGYTCQVSLETMMACGMAACLGCAVAKPDGSGYLHVCKDGPVFEASEVTWT